MKIKAVLFDLDGTLLPMDNTQAFGRNYFEGVREAFSRVGRDVDEVLAVLREGIGKMVRNDGSVSNEQAFWNHYSLRLGRERAIADEKIFARFYEEGFDCVREACSPSPRSREAVEIAKKRGLRVVLATNPVFPPIAQEKRICWAGVDKDSFEFITTYENSGFCKPNPSYFLDVARRLGLQPEECAMVGNDVREDTVAEKIGMKFFLLTPCLLNVDDADYSSYVQGGYDELMEFLKNV